MHTSEAHHKKIAEDFLNLIIEGKIDEAYEKYVDMAGKHHNTFFPAGFDSLKQAMKENELQTPNKKFEMNHVIADGDMVAVHSHLRFKEGEAGMITVHLFRFENNKIVEFWDCGQVIPDDCPNADGAF